MVYYILQKFRLIRRTEGRAVVSACFQSFYLSLKEEESTYGCQRNMEFPDTLRYQVLQEQTNLAFSPNV